MAHRMQFLKTNINLVVATSNDEAEATITLNGILRGVKSSPPEATDSGATVTVDILDPDGDTVYTKADLVADTPVSEYFDTQTNPSPLEIPVAGTYTIKTSYSASQDTNKTMTVTLFVETFI